MDIELRDVTAEDVVVFFDHQADPISSEMAAVASRDFEAHAAHWAKNLADPTTVNKTVLSEGKVVGNCVSWAMDDHRYIGYWIDRGCWGRGIASAALVRFLEIVTERPVYATVAVHNPASLRVLEKAGFVLSVHKPDSDDGVELLGLELRA